MLKDNSSCLLPSQRQVAVLVRQSCCVWAPVLPWTCYVGRFPPACLPLSYIPTRFCSSTETSSVSTSTRTASPQEAPERISPSTTASLEQLWRPLSAAQLQMKRTKLWEPQIPPTVMKRTQNVRVGILNLVIHPRNLPTSNPRPRKAPAKETSGIK